jgi:hypothetical protein
MNATMVDVLNLGGLDLADLDADKCRLKDWHVNGFEHLDGSFYCANACKLPDGSCDLCTNADVERRRHAYRWCHWWWLHTDVREMLERQEHPALERRRERQFLQVRPSRRGGRAVQRRHQVFRRPA